jgi:hypothetical protein
MAVELPVFVLIAAGYAAVLFRFVSEAAHEGISEFAFGIAIPALLLRTIVVSEFPDVSPWRMWGAYYGALAIIWTAALARPPCSRPLMSESLPSERRHAATPKHKASIKDVASSSTVRNWLTPTPRHQNIARQRA